MRTKIWIPILFLVIFAGCRSTKETLRTKVDTKTEATVKASTSVDSVTNTVDRSAAVIKTDEVITIAELSKPDSAGRQYITKVTTITRKQNTAVRNDVKKESRVKASSDYKSDVKQKTAVKQTSTTTHSVAVPWWVWLIIIIIAFITSLFLKFK